MEIWKDIIGMEGFYQISNTGKVKGLPRKIERKNGTPAMNIKERLISANIDSTGYLRVGMRKYGEYFTCHIHRLIAEHFIEKPKTNDRLCVNHKDGNSLNNDISNLEWVSWRENISHASKSKLPPCVSLTPNKKRFRVIARIKGITKRYVGTYDTISDAVAAYEKYLSENNTQNRYA